MPGSLQLAAPTAVFPSSLSTSFSLDASFPLLHTSYNDGTLERSMLVDGVNPARPARVWKLAKRLTTTQATTLLTFFESTVLGGFRAFYFYDPYAPFPGNSIGSNYDATGVSTQGRVVVHFLGNWQHVVTLGRINIASLTLVEVT